MHSSSFPTVVRRAVVPVIATLALLMIGPGKAEAAVAQWSVRAPYSSGTINELGWHFDEIGAQQFGARDYGTSSGAPANAYFRAVLSQTSQYPLRFKLDFSTNCRVVVNLQTYYAFQWLDVSRTEMHVIHVQNGPTGIAYTGTIQTAGNSVSVFLGQTALCNLTNGYHEHLSADFSAGSRIQGARSSTDTCWSNTDDFTGQNLYQCPGTFKAHKSTPPPACPPGAWNGAYWLLSGTISQYYCETWSLMNVSALGTQFYGVW